MTRTVAAQAAHAPHGMVASSSLIASQVGASILKRGGNAVDAAVAVGLALAVTHPSAGNLGGGGFMLVRMADGRSSAIDYRETAPARATRDMYLDKSGAIIPHASTLGARAVGVPGTVAGLAAALKMYGTLPWHAVVEPARRLAANGFWVGPGVASMLRHGENLTPFAESRRIFLNRGAFYREGDVFRQPDLAATLGRLETFGPREFYEGRTARLLVREMGADGGLISLSDLKRYRPALRRPLHGTYRGYDLLTMPPPSSGGITLLEMLNMLEHYDLASLGAGTAQTDHLLVETMRRAFADRAQFLGDPDFVTVPTAGLTAKSYAAVRLQSILPEAATPSSAVGHGAPPRKEETQTTHFSVVDAHGNAVSNTYTLNGNFGCGVTVRGAGFLLNNEMDDFLSKTGVPNQFGLIQGTANAIAPHKRPLSSMAPTIVLRKGKLAFVIGSPGGPTIINTVLQVTLNIIDHGMSLREAITAPRLHHQWLPDLIASEPKGMNPNTRAMLRKEGYAFKSPPSYMGDAEGVMIDPQNGWRQGASDPRWSDGGCAGY